MEAVCFGPRVCVGLLTESSCVCRLGEIFWHFPVDIESEERKEEEETKEKKRARTKNAKRKHRAEK